MQTARNLVDAVVELAASMKHGHDDFESRPPLRVHLCWDTSSVVGNRDTAIKMEMDVDGVTVASQELIDGIVHKLVDEVMQACGSCIANVHPWTLANSL
jgi:hypothetical protein